MKPYDINAFDALREMRVALIGMSGVGKTHLSKLLRAQGDWYHYSVDYRLGSAYLSESIDDDLRDIAMKTPRLAGLLRSDGVSIRAKFGIENLNAMSDYLGKVGDVRNGGLDPETFLNRQNIHARAETNAMADVGEFIRKAREVYNYRNFVCDTSGSLCSIVDPWDAEDKILSNLASNAIIVYIEASEQDKAALISRFRREPKPIFYSEPFFRECEAEYLASNRDWSQVLPDTFSQWAFEKIVDFREPRYAAIADGWGYRIRSSDLRNISSAEQFVSCIRSNMQEQQLRAS